MPLKISYKIWERARNQMGGSRQQSMKQHIKKSRWVKQSFISQIRSRCINCKGKKEGLKFVRVFGIWEQFCSYFRNKRRKKKKNGLGSLPNVGRCTEQVWQMERSYYAPPRSSFYLFIIAFISLLHPQGG